MKTLTYILLLGAIPALSWVIPDFENAQHIFGQSRNPLAEAQEFFEKLEEQVESRLDSIVEELQDIGHGAEYANTAIDDAFEEYLDLGPNENLEFWDIDACQRHDDVEGSLFEATKKKHYNYHHHHDHKKYRGGKYHGDHNHHDPNPDYGYSDPFDGTDPGDGPPYRRGSRDPPHHGPKSPRGIPHVYKPHMPPRDHTGPHYNSTMWDLISKSKHTHRFYELIKSDQDVVNILKDKKYNHTVFAPSNHAFELLDEYIKHHDLPKRLIHQVLLYHIAPGSHKSQDLRYHNTLKTNLPDGDLGKNMYQRLRIGLNHHGPSVNFYSQFTMLDVCANNGVIHGIDAILFPPPELLDLVRALPTEFSTTETALHRAGLLKELPKLRGKGLTVFAPSNRDWQKLGFKINAFLFSECGNAYLRALMKYHIAPNQTLYSDALVSPGETRSQNECDDRSGLNHGYSHVDLPTLLKDKHLSVDITRIERFLSFRVNGLTSIVISDGIAKSGVIQVPDHVLIPPHSLKDHRNPPKNLDVGTEEEDWPYSLDEFKQILEPFVEQEQLELNELRRQGYLEL